MPQKTHTMHGRDHCPGGADPIPCLIPYPAGTYQDAVLAESTLWAYWPLQDESGGPVEVVAGRDMTAVEYGSPYLFTYAQPGPVNGDALEFVGQDTAIVNNLGTHAYYDFAGGDATELYDTDGFTVEMWFWAATPAINTQLGGPDYQGILATQGNPVSDVSYWQLGLDPAGNLVFIAGGTWGISGPVGDDDLLLTAVPNIPEQWVHAAVTYDGTTVKLYVDGGLADSGAVAGLTGDSRFQIGRQATDATTDGQYARYLEGRLAHVALYTAALPGGTIGGHADSANFGGGAGSEFQMLESDGAGGVRWAFPSFEVEY